MPIADQNGIFGRIVTRRDVQNAVVQTLQAWVPTYIGQLEQQAQLVTGTVPVPPDMLRSYRGGLDFDTWEPSWSPAYVVVTQALGTPELTGGAGSYIQVFDVQVACNFQYDGVAPTLGEYEEDNALQYADILGMAGCAALVQHGGLVTWPDGTWVSTRTRLTQFPKTTFPMPMEASSRRFCRSAFGLSVVVADVVTEGFGPANPLANPYPNAGDWPMVRTTNVDVIAIPDAQSVPAGSSTTDAREG